MSDTSTIEWTDATWNPVTGCTKVSEGCDHCYAETFAERWRGIPGHPYEQGFDLKLWPERLDMPLRWHKPRRVFVNSMSDLFHDGVPFDFIARVFAVMAEAPQHTFQVLTKRSARAASLLNRLDFIDRVDRAVCDLSDQTGARLLERGWNGEWPLANVWLGVSVETQKWADVRIPKLQRAPAEVRFLSCEPLLGALDLTRYFVSSQWGKPLLDWIIVGGESGPGARPVDPTWVRSIRDQATDHCVPFFFKQWGGRTPKANGRELDGRTWDQYPERAA